MTFEETFTKLGFSNRDEYSHWRRTSHSETDKLLEYDSLLSPNVIDSSEFWEASNKLFGTLPICGNHAITDKDKAGKMNLYSEINDYGILNGIRPNFPNVGNILEIGPGYGNMKDYIEKNYSYMNYHGIDVFPLAEGIEKCDGKSIPEKLKDRKYDWVFSANVFQHLSVEQRRGYYSDIGEVLDGGGIFTFYMLVDDNLASNGSMDGYRKIKGRHYVEHFGQLTMIQSIKEVLDDVRSYGELCRHRMEYAFTNSVATFTFVKTQSEKVYKKTMEEWGI